MKFGVVAGIVILAFSGILQCAAPVTTRIIDVFDDHVTMQVSGSLSFKKGDRVDIPYQAGLVEMPIGTHEVIQTKESEFIARVVSSSMSASRGMNIHVSPAASLVEVQALSERTNTDAGAMEDESRDPRFLPPNQEVQKGDPEKPAATTEISEIGIKGMVKEVMGDKVRVAFTSAQKPQVGFMVEISGRGEGGVSKLMGLWEVEEVRENELIAKKLAADDAPRVGQAARIFELSAAGFRYLESKHLPVIPLDSEEGQALLQGHDAVDYLSLKQNWVAQLRMHCCAASAVIVMNSLQPGGSYTQNSLFVPETAHIITQDEVYRAQFTLEKLADLIHTRSGLTAQYYHAGSGESENDYSAFREHLKKNAENTNDYMIIAYSLTYVSGFGGGGGGHASPVAAYNEEKDMVLMLEVEASRREPFWISTADIYGAMNTIDPVCNKHRGWLIVTR